MTIPILFWLLTLAGCAYAAAAGGRDGRWASILIISASVLTVPVTLLGRSWQRPEMGVLAIDFLLLLSLYLLALSSKRYFPIWMTGFHLIAVVTHLGAAVAPEFTPEVYRGLAGLWAIPVTLSMVLGILLDQRMNASAAGPVHRPAHPALPRPALTASAGGSCEQVQARGRDQRRVRGRSRSGTSRARWGGGSPRRSLEP